MEGPSFDSPLLMDVQKQQAVCTISMICVDDE